MTKKLFAEAILKFTLGIVLVGALLFWPAGTLNWWNGWLFMGILFVPMFLAGLVMMAKDPNLLRSRLKAKEEQKEQEQQQQQQNQQEQQQEMSKENAEQLLQAAMQDEKDVQEKVKKMMQMRGRKLEKDW